MEIETVFSLKGKVALVTGGYYGIGFAIVSGLAAAGARIAFNGVHADSVEGAREQCAKAGIDAVGYVSDVTDEAQVKEMIADIEKETGPIHILVNSAGVIKRVPICEMDVVESREVINMDLATPFIVAKTVTPGMIQNGGGKIINICSMMSELGRETVSACASARDDPKMLTKNITSECGEYNIQCNGIGPDYITMPQTASLRESEHLFNSFTISKTPAVRWGEPSNLIGLAVFLVSSASDFTSGHILYVDGGILTYIGKQPR